MQSEKYSVQLKIIDARWNNSSQSCYKIFLKKIKLLNNFHLLKARETLLHIKNWNSVFPGGTRKLLKQPIYCWYNYPFVLYKK